MADGAGEIWDDHRPELCLVPEEDEMGMEATVSSNSAHSTSSPALRKSMGSEGSISLADCTHKLNHALTNDMRARNLWKVEDELQQERNSLRHINFRSQMIRFHKFVLPRDGRPWIHSNFASCLFGGIIILNAIFIGFETDYHRPEGDEGFVLNIWFFMESAFLIAFGLELLLRFRADGLPLLCDYWGMFDLLVVLLGVVDTWLLPACVAGSSLSEMGRLSMFRLLRLVRIVRVLRILRLLRFVRELLLLVRGIAGALRALGWSFLMMCIVLYISAVFATEIMRETFHLHDPEAAQDPDIMQINSWFGSIGTSFLTLSQLMTLEGWPTLVRKTALEHNHVWLLCFFLPFIFCTNFALLNVVTALMVEKVFEFAHDEMMHEAKKQLKERKAAIHKILKLFSNIDEDNDGKLHSQTVKDAAENPVLMKQFQELGMARHDIDSLILCVDVDGKGELTVAEFVEGCLRMHGPANSKDLLRIQYDVHRTWKALDLKRLTRYLEWTMRCLQNDSERLPNDPRSRPRTKTQPAPTVPPRASAKAEDQPPMPRLDQLRSNTLPSLTAVMKEGNGPGQSPSSLDTPDVPESTGISNEDTAGLMLPEEAQSLLEDVISEQQQTRQLLEVLGNEMRDLRNRIQSSRALALPVVQRPRRSIGPDEGPVTPPTNASVRQQVSERSSSSRNPNLSTVMKAQLSKGLEQGCRTSRLEVPRTDRRKSSFDSMEATVRTSQVLVSATSEVRRTRDAVNEDARLRRESLGSDSQFSGIVPGSLGSLGPSDTTS